MDRSEHHRVLGAASNRSWAPGPAQALRLVAFVASYALWSIGLPAQAGSLTSSAASSALDSLSTSVGVFSGAVSGVSTSSSPGGGKVAQGDYHIERATTLEGTPARLALRLQAVREPAAAGDAWGPPDAPQGRGWTLRLPQAVALAQALEPGQVLTVRERPYGFGLWKAGQAQPFYLVVHDTWAQALQAHPVP
jgi:hypothetical protein